jgi:hypothetical protein
VQEQWSEAQMERLGMQRARVLEVNRQLAALTDPSVPLHMNLAVGGASDNFISRLKQQNHLLTEVRFFYRLNNNEMTIIIL